MKRILYLAALLLCVWMPASAQGLRHSVCIVEPEYSEADKSLMGDYALYTARAGMRSASRALSAYKNEGTFGSGVVIEQVPTPRKDRPLRALRSGEYRRNGLGGNRPSCGM